MSTKKQNVELFDRVNTWWHSIGADGKYNRDRIFQSLGIAPAKDGTYSGAWGLNGSQRKAVQKAIEAELGFALPPARARSIDSHQTARRNALICAL